ncbi:MAG: hypothetical protein MI748_20095 [Opitutales bacterium]|nr:hypothetical protein [Opitutales bacterium]
MSKESNQSSDVTMSAIENPKNISLIALIVGVVGLAIAGAGLVFGLFEGDSRPWFSWLIGVAFWMSILIGSLLLIMITYAFDAGWSVIIRRQLEHMVSAFPWMALIFLPLILQPWISSQPGILWKWMNPDTLLHNGHTVGHDPIYLWKEVYLNLPWMTIRTVAYFGIFIGVSMLLRKYSFTLESDGNTRWVNRARRTSAFGIFGVGLGLTFAAFDWFMSLDYHWFSTMFGVWYFASSVRATIAFTIILCYFLSTRGYLKGIYNQAHRYDLGTLLLAFTVFWAYICFSQMFLIYQANIPEETFWYNLRLYTQEGGNSLWWWIAMSLVFLHFFVPFFFLVFYSTKVSVGRLVFIASWILSFHLLDLYFNILPGEIMTTDGHFIIRSFSVTLFDICSILGIGGIVIWSFLRSSKKVKPIPIKDPRILESIHHHE